MLNLNKILLIFLFTTYLFSDSLGDTLLRLKAKDESRIVKKENVEITYWIKNISI